VIKSKNTLTGGQAAVKSLKKEKVKHVFGLIGSATMEMFDALYHEKKIKFIGVRDERTGTHMADGYARASNQPGVIIAGQNGPGATNLVTGIAQAKAAFSPVVSIAGLYSTKDKMEDAFQGLDQQSLFNPITKKTWTVKKASHIPKAFSDAFNLAMSPRRGPVCINLPRNVLSDTSKFKINVNKKSFKSESNLKSKINLIQKTTKLILNSKKTVIVAGGGIKYNSKFKSVTDLAEFLNVPIVTAAGHGDAIPFSHKLNAGQMGPRGNLVASRLVKEAELIIALGTRLGLITNQKDKILDLNEEIKFSILLKLFIFPFIIFLVSKLLKFDFNQSLAVILQAGTPTAISTILMAEAYGVKQKIASKILFTTTLISVVTIPLLTIIMNSLNQIK